MPFITTEERKRELSLRSSENSSSPNSRESKHKG